MLKENVSKAHLDISGDEQNEERDILGIDILRRMLQCSINDT